MTFRYSTMNFSGEAGLKVHAVKDSNFRHSLAGKVSSDQKRAGFSLIELLVVMAIISFLVALLLLMLKSAKEMANGVKCVNNLRQIGAAMYLYAGDYDNYAAKAVWNDNQNPGLWYGKAVKYAGTTINQNNPGIMRCPSDPVFKAGLQHAQHGDWISYGYNLYGFGSVQTDPQLKLAQVKKPAQTYWVADNSDNAVWSGCFFNNSGDGCPSSRHRGGLNILWVDGHVSWLDRKTCVLHYVGGAGEPWWDLN